MLREQYHEGHNFNTQSLYTTSSVLLEVIPKGMVKQNLILSVSYF